MRKSNFKTVELVNFINNNELDVINLLHIIKISLFKTNMMSWLQASYQDNIVTS